MERGHEDKTQIGNLYSLALSGFGASLCRGLQSRATRCSGSTKSRSAKICHANLAHSRELQSYGGGKRKELAYTKPRRTSGILILENSTKKFDLRNGCVTSSLARSPSISSSLSSESFEASNPVNEIRRRKINKGQSFQPLSNMLENNQLLLIVLGVLMMSRSPKQPISPSTLAGFVRVTIFLRIALVYPR
jgi:hypothetical protein